VVYLTPSGRTLQCEPLTPSPSKERGKKKERGADAPLNNSSIFLPFVKGDIRGIYTATPLRGLFPGKKVKKLRDKLRMMRDERVGKDMRRGDMLRRNKVVQKTFSQKSVVHLVF
jgi:hypothetical protein